MSDDIFEHNKARYLKPLPSEGNIPIASSYNPRDNNQIIKINMVFPQIGIVTHG
jgi:hypothetical protein